MVKSVANATNIYENVENFERVYYNETGSGKEQFLVCEEGFEVSIVNVQRLN